MKLTYTEAKFYPEVNSQTGLNSLWVLCKRAFKHGHKNETQAVIAYFAQSCYTFMGSRYLKAYRPIKMAPGKNDYFYGDDLEAILTIIDANMFQNNRDMQSDILVCVKN